MARERIFFIDLIKALSIISVVSFHSNFLPIDSYEASAPLLEILFAPLRFCVPLLLVISFFLLERSSQGKNNRSIGALIKSRLVRLLTPTIFWFSLSVLKLIIQGKSALEIGDKLITGEAFTGAYYLLILFQLIPLALCFKSKWKTSIYFWLVISLQGLIYLAIFTLAKTNILANEFNWLQTAGRSLGIYWIAYVAMGISLHHNFSYIEHLSKRLSLWLKAFLLSILAVGFMIEYSHLIAVFNNSVPPFEYVMFSCLISVPIVLLCCMDANPYKLPKWSYQSILLFSRYSLGIFCINGILSQVFLAAGARLFSEYTFDFTQALTIRILGWLVLLTISLYGSILLEKAGLKKMVC